MPFWASVMGFVSLCLLTVALEVKRLQQYERKFRKEVNHEEV